MHKEKHAFFFISPVLGNKAVLTKEEYRHARFALRMGSEAVVYATAGNGNIYKCRLAADGSDAGEVEIIETIPRTASSPAVYLYIGLPEREAFEEALTGLAALGAARIVPVVCDYCQGAWWDPWEKRSERLLRKMVAGIKQAHNPWLPDLHTPQPFHEAVRAVCEETDGQALRLLADPGGTALEGAFRGAGHVNRIDCFIGPPGGFSPDELKRFDTEGFRSVKVAHYRLRTELAAIVTCAGIMQRFIGTNVLEGPTVLSDVE